MMLKYAVKKNYIIFLCSGINENQKAAALLTDFLLELSEDHKVFVHGCGLSEEDAQKLIDAHVILQRAGTLRERLDTYFYLSEARIDVNYLGRAQSAAVYYFDKEVDWQDFLASSKIDRPNRFIQKGILQAVLLSDNQGRDYSFQCSRKYETRVMRLLKEMADAGCEIKHSFQLSSR